jgi:hypothetical protein
MRERQTQASDIRLSIFLLNLFFLLRCLIVAVLISFMLVVSASAIELFR